jgi:hypothetical protein
MDEFRAPDGDIGAGDTGANVRRDVDARATEE